MNKEKLIELAKQAGWEYADDDRGFEPLWDFAKLVAAAAVRETSAEYRMGWNDGQINEREAIIDEWSMCVQSDLEHGVKSLNEQAAKDWFKNYPEISKFWGWLNARSNT